MKSLYMKYIHSVIKNIKEIFYIDYKKFYKKSQYKVVLITAIICSIISYLYYAMNNVHNYDSIFCTPSGIGGTLESGRWMLGKINTWQCNFAGGTWYNSAFTNTIIALFFLVISCLLLIYVLEIENKGLCIAITSITITFPTIAATFVFNFTVYAYMLAVLFVMLAAFFSKKQNFLCFLISAFFLACSLGVYQAYFAFAAQLFVLILIKDCFNEENTWKTVFFNAIKYFGELVLGYVFYMMILNHYLKIYNTTLVDYQGIDNMGLDIRKIPVAIKTIYCNFFAIMKEDYMSMSATGLVQIVIRLCYIIVFICIVIFLVKIVKEKEILKSLLLIALIAIFPIAADAIEIMAPDATIYSLMILGMIGVFYLPIVLADNIIISIAKIKSFIVLFTAVVILFCSLNYCYITNVNYTSLHYKLEVAENYFVNLYGKIINTQGYNSDMEIVFYGTRFANTPDVRWNIGKLEYLGTGFDINVYSNKSIMELYIGDTYRMITDEERELYNSELESMKVFPDDGAIKIIDNIVVVKIE